MDNNRFKEELHNRAISEVTRRGYSFSSEANNQLLNLIAEGVNRMNNTGRTSHINMDEARRNMTYLCIKLVERENSKNHIVESRTFTSARFSICPLWPFC